ncbi:MAG: hypothetical protein WA364_26320 [Candidatus Nitrosopolaris sp.]
MSILYASDVRQSIPHDPTKIDKKELEKIRRTYTKVKRERGAEIKSIIRITRNEPIPRFYENTDFSIETIRNSIKDGESLTNRLLGSSPT